MDKMRQLTNNIKNEIEARPEDGVAPLREKEMTSIISSIESNADLVRMYQESSKMGSDNLQSSLPILKVHTTNKSVKNLLADGTEPNDGWFFYGKTGQQFKNPVVHVLTISKGFRAEGMTDTKTGKKKENVFNQILGGVIVDGSDYLPFIYYFTGVKLAKMWEFGKEASKYTQAKPVSIPMFALSVKLSTVKERDSYGMNWIVNFEILKNESGFPILVKDQGEFVFLRDSVATIEDTIASLIASKVTNEKIIVDDEVKAAEEVFEVSNEVGSDDIGF